MPSGNAIVVRYWVSTDHRPFPDLEGVDDFRRELSDAYVSIVHGRPAGAGGFTHLHVELLSTFSLHHLVQLLLDGVAFDLVKHGAEAFVLRPFIEAYKRLRDRNKKNFVDIGDLQIEFQDSRVILHEISSDTLLSQLESIFLALAHSYRHLILENGDSPFEIHVPVFEDPAEDCPCRFRMISLFDDETIRLSGPEDYLGFWGLTYDLGGRKVFDVKRKLTINEHWNTLEQHWAEIMARENARSSGRPKEQ
jgi:hypothetical protein